MTNVRSRFNDWMFKVLFFLVPFLFIPLLSVRVSAVAITTQGSDSKEVTATAEFATAQGDDKTKITYDGSDHANNISVKFWTDYGTSTAAALTGANAPVPTTDYTLTWYKAEDATTPVTELKDAGVYNGEISVNSKSAK